tara:strand:- start:6066 stop:6212 length:147 start_codon:yes stop_codon:yes gene_type:complete
MNKEIRKIIVMLDNVYEEILDTCTESEEREEVLSKIDDVQYLIEDLDE